MAVTSALDFMQVDALLKVNDAVVGSQLTDDFEGWQGCYSFVHDFPAVNNASTTYTVSVSFNGADAVSASATSITLGGSNYAMCTTIQYGNQPCGNSTMLTVDPQSTIAMISTKTPEEKQQARVSLCFVFFPVLLRSTLLSMCPCREHQQVLSRQR